MADADQTFAESFWGKPAAAVGGFTLTGSAGDNAADVLAAKAQRSNEASKEVVAYLKEK